MESSSEGKHSAWLAAFISKIEINEKVKDETTGKKSQDIDIYFTHAGKMS
ncbi:MAG: DUF4368 domain-containing protein [Ruminococcus sp.]|nr:DUF4368 domain-containing protein [Ruminococcus sp.]